MPPFRSSIDFSAKPPLKTERTHEENQERAYIAASRRSDRSLEARVESARRASEIHKRRTGRSLRVTEQDVINEEMYEEEDDDLPMQYRRLTAHLQTSNADFDRRLAAYLTNHVAMRTALGQAVSDSYGQQQQAQAQGHAQQGNQFYANPLHFSSPSLLAPSPSTSAPSFRNQPQNNQSAGARKPSPDSGERQSSPYSLATQQAFQAAMHGRSASVANRLSTLGPNGLQIARRASGPVQGVPPPGRTSSNPAAGVKSEGAAAETAGRPTTDSPSDASQRQQPSTFPPAFHNFGDFDASSLAPNGPFSTTLPVESQQLLGGALDPNDPMTTLLMGGHPQQQQHHQQFYSYNPNGDVKNSFTSMPNRALGINQTLSPGYMGGFNHDLFGTQRSGTRDVGSSSISPYETASAFDRSSSYDDFLRPSGPSDAGTPQDTPALEKDWQNLFDGSLWEEQAPPSSQTSVVAA